MAVQKCIAEMKELVHQLADKISELEYENARLKRENYYFKSLESKRVNEIAEKKSPPHISKQLRFEPIENLQVWTKSGDWCNWVHFY